MIPNDLQSASSIPSTALPPERSFRFEPNLHQLLGYICARFTLVSQGIREAELEIIKRVTHLLVPLDGLVRIVCRARAKRRRLIPTSLMGAVEMLSTFDDILRNTCVTFRQTPFLPAVYRNDLYQSGLHTAGRGKTLIRFL